MPLLGIVDGLGTGSDGIRFGIGSHFPEEFTSSGNGGRIRLFGTNDADDVSVLSPDFGNEGLTISEAENSRS